MLPNFLVDKMFLILTRQLKENFSSIDQKPLRFPNIHQVPYNRTATSLLSFSGPSSAFLKSLALLALIKWWSTEKHSLLRCRQLIDNILDMTAM